MRLNWLISASMFLATATATVAQDSNMIYPVPMIEQRLLRDTFRILEVRGSRLSVRKKEALNIEVEP